MSSHVHESLSAYLDRELPVHESERVEGHLRGCPECAQHLADLAAVDQVARTLPEAAPPGYFDQFPSRVRQRLARPRGRQGLRPPVWTWAAAAALLLAVLTPLTLRRSPEPSTAVASPRPESAPAPPAEEATTRSDELRALGDAADRSATAADAELKKGKETERLRTRDARSDSGRLAASERPTDGSWRTSREADRPLAPPPPAARPPASAPLEESRAGQGASSVAAAAEAPKPAAGLDDRLPAPSAPERVVEAGPGKASMAGPAQTSPAGREKNEPGVARGRAYTKEATALEARYRALRDRRAASVAEAQALREEWRAFAREHPASPWADEARVRVVEAGLQAYRLGSGEADLALCREDVTAYLRRDDALQKARVEALHAALDR